MSPAARSCRDRRRSVADLLAILIELSPDKVERLDSANAVVSAVGPIGEIADG
jgi:hypothetical protein